MKQISFLTLMQGMWRGLLNINLNLDLWPVLIDPPASVIKDMPFFLQETGTRQRLPVE